MKKLATALAGAALIVTLAGPAGATVASRPADYRTVAQRPPECYGHRHRWTGGRDCTDEHRPQHDGHGWLLF